jgi:hypothetical protein
MTIQRVAIIFDTTLRPETAGVYCQHALERLVEVQHFQPHELDRMPRTGFYVLLVEYTVRLFRDGKAAISSELEEILERIGSTAESWWARIEKLSKGRLLGRFFAVSRARPREVAAHLGVHHLANLAGCPAR